MQYKSQSPIWRPKFEVLKIIVVPQANQLLPRTGPFLDRGVDRGPDISDRFEFFWLFDVMGPR